MTLTSLLMRQLTGGSRVADTGTASAVAPLGGVITGLAAAMQVTAGSGMQRPGERRVLRGPAPHRRPWRVPVRPDGPGNPDRRHRRRQPSPHRHRGRTRQRPRQLGPRPATWTSSPARPRRPRWLRRPRPRRLLLAQVLVPTSASSIISGDITDERTWTAPPGGIIPVANAAAAPAAPVDAVVLGPGHRSVLCQGTGTAGQLDAVSASSQAGTQSIVVHLGGRRASPRARPHRTRGASATGRSAAGGGKGGGGAPATDGTVAIEIKVTFTADGTSRLRDRLPVGRRDPGRRARRRDARSRQGR